MKAAIISLESESSKWTFEAMKKYFDEVDQINVRNLEISITGSTAQILHEGEPLKKYDCIYAKGSFRYSQVLRSLTSILYKDCYIPIIPSAFTIAHDKLLTQLMMQQHSIPMPKTYISSTIDSARQLLSSLNYPIIMKFPQGTQGKGVVFADSYSSGSSILDALTALRQPFILQEFVDTDGEDIRALVVGGKVVAAMKRKASGTEKRANMHAGGTAETIILDGVTERIAVKTAKALNASICGVDILMNAKGPVVIEANISPGLQGITATTGVDVADHIARHLFSETEKRLTQDKNAQHKVVLSEVEENNTLMTSLDFRGNRILIPEIMTKRCRFNEDEMYEIMGVEGKLVIKKININ